MKKLAKTLNKNKLLILLLIIIIIFLIFCIRLILVFTESDEKAFYGTRLDGIEKVELDIDKTRSKITEKLGDHIGSVSIRTQGRIINIIINVTGNISKETAKDDARRVLEELTEDERNYYDIQIYINKLEEAEDSRQFPIIGYKHHTKTDISWTKDRTGNDE